MQRRDIDGLADVLVHACLDAKPKVFLERAGRHRNVRQSVPIEDLPDLARGRRPVP